MSAENLIVTFLSLVSVKSNLFVIPEYKSSANCLLQMANPQDSIKTLREIKMIMFIY